MCALIELRNKQQITLKTTGRIKWSETACDCSYGKREVYPSNRYPSQGTQTLGADPRPGSIE